MYLNNTHKYPFPHPTFLSVCLWMQNFSINNLFQTNTAVMVSHDNHLLISRMQLEFRFSLFLFSFEYNGPSLHSVSCQKVTLPYISTVSINYFTKLSFSVAYHYTSILLLRRRSKLQSQLFICNNALLKFGCAIMMTTALTRISIYDIKFLIKNINQLVFP